MIDENSFSSSSFFRMLLRLHYFPWVENEIRRKILRKILESHEWLSEILRCGMGGKIFVVVYFGILLSSEKFAFRVLFLKCAKIYVFSHEGDIHFMFMTIPCQDAEESQTQTNNQTISKLNLQQHSISTSTQAFNKLWNMLILKSTALEEGKGRM